MLSLRHGEGMVVTWDVDVDIDHRNVEIAPRGCVIGDEE